MTKTRFECTKEYAMDRVVAERYNSNHGWLWWQTACPHVCLYHSVIPPRCCLCERISDPCLICQGE